MRALAFIFALLLATPANSALLWFSGGETGTSGDEIGSAGTMTAHSGGTRPCQSGKWCYFLSEGVKALYQSCVSNCPSTTGSALWTAASTLYVRFAIKVDVIANPSSNITASDLLTFGPTSPHTSKLQLAISSAGVVTLSSVHSTTLSTTLADDTWYTVDVKAVGGGGGSFETWVNGASLGAQSASNGTSSGAINFGWNPSATNSAQYKIYFDDLAVRDDDWTTWGGATRGLGSRALTRQGVTGTETYTAGTATGCTASTPESCWSDSPADETTYIRLDSSGSLTRQSMLLDSFLAGTTGSAETDGVRSTFGSRDQLIGCRTVARAKRSSGSNPGMALLRRDGGANTTWTVPSGDISTTIATHAGAIQSPATISFTNIEGAEIGEERAAGAGAQFWIYDIWESCYINNAPPFTMRIK